jgi:peroxiredoxin
MNKTNCSLQIVRTLLAAICLTTTPQRSSAESSATQPAILASPVPAKADISPEARRELDSVRDAYAKLTSLQLHGVMSGEMEMAGKKHSLHTEFDSTFLAPNKFKHASAPTAADPTTFSFGSTGNRAYLLIAGSSKSSYLIELAPKNRQSIESPRGTIWSTMKQMDPGLALVTAWDAGRFLARDATRVTKDADVTVEGKTYTALKIASPLSDITAFVDPATHLLRRLTINTSIAASATGQNGMKALVTFDYTTKNIDVAALTDAFFAWTPPADAKEIMQPAKVSATLTGYTAPNITLSDTDGVTISLSSLKGSVVVLDFWATWCSPCVRSLPKLNQLWNDNRAAGMKVFAVNEGEPKNTITNFITSNHYTLPVLMDTDGVAGDAFKVGGIPQTVIIGKDGSIKKVIVGFDPDSEKLIRAAVESALAER